MITKVDESSRNVYVTDCDNSAIRYYPCGKSDWLPGEQEPNDKENYLEKERSSHTQSFTLATLLETHLNRAGVFLKHNDNFQTVVAAFHSLKNRFQEEGLNVELMDDSELDELVRQIAESVQSRVSNSNHGAQFWSFWSQPKTTIHVFQLEAKKADIVQDVMSKRVADSDPVEENSVSRTMRP